MAEYVNVPIETDPDALAQDAFDYLGAKVPGWLPSDAEFDTWLISANARMGATLRDTASDVPTAIFRYYGAKVVGLQPIAASAASSTATFVATDTVGHTVPTGTAVAVQAPDGLIAFKTVGDAVIAPASTTIAGVPIVAVTEGSDSSSLGSPGDVVQLIDQLSYISSITLDATTSGGVDAEEDDVYLGRLVDELRLMAPRPILPNDFAVLARNVAGVGRALALDGYNPDDDTSGNERFVTVAVVDPAGAELSGPSMTTIAAYLDSLREMNFEVRVIGPTGNPVDVQWEAVAWEGWDTADVTARVNAALATYLDPSVWGTPPFGDSFAWYLRPAISYRDLIGVVAKVDGVKDVHFVKIRPGSGAYTEADIAMTGAAPLPMPGTIAGTCV